MNKDNLFINTCLVISYILLIIGLILNCYNDRIQKGIYNNHINTIDSFKYQEKVFDQIIEIQENQIDKLKTENSLLLQEIELLKRKFVIDVDISAYTARKQECDSTPHKTAIMETPKVGWTIAVSENLMWTLGKKVYIKGIGVKKVSKVMKSEDLMNERYINRIDILVGSVKEARKFGVKQGQLIVLGD